MKRRSATADSRIGREEIDVNGEFEEDDMAKHSEAKRTMFHSMMSGACLLIIITVLVFDVLIMSNTWRNEKEELLDTSEQLTLRLQTAISDYVSQMDATMSSINYGLLDDSKEYIYKLLSDAPYESNAEQVKINHYMTHFFAKLGLMQPELSSVYIYINDDKHFYWARSGHLRPGYSPKEKEWMRKTILLDGQTYTHINAISEGSTVEKPVIGFSRKLKNLSNEGINGDSLILFEYDISMIDRIVENCLPNDACQVLLVKDDGDVAYRYGQVDLGEADIDFSVSGTRDGGARFVRLNGGIMCLAEGRQKVLDWRIAVLSDYSEFIQSFWYYLRNSIIIGLGMIILAMIPAYLYVQRLCRDVERLEAAMLQLCGGDFSIRLEPRRRDEIGSLMHCFNDMAERTQHLIQQQYEQALEKREAEYKYLQAQIDPHFIFNALQVISSMAIVNGVESIEAVSNSLARLLSYSLSTDSKVITLEEELKNVKQYMVIQQTRFRDKLNYEVDVDPEILGYKIIKMVLQPIVENAISHGLNPRGGAGTIRIHGIKHRDGCVLMVCDDGIGMDGEQLRQLQRFINGDDDAQMKTRGHGVGLRNIHNRLKLYYGEQYGLKIESTPGVGTTIMVRIAMDAGD